MLARGEQMAAVRLSMLHGSRERAEDMPRSCEGCVYKSRCNDGYVDECWQLTEIRGLARELGIEVPE